MRKIPKLHFSHDAILPKLIETTKSLASGVTAAGVSHPREVPMLASPARGGGAKAV